MRIDPELLALRSDPASQRHAQSVLEAARDDWLRVKAMAAVVQGLESFGTGAPLDACHGLGELFVTRGKGEALVSDLFAALARAVAAHPLGQVPLRHQYNGGVGVLQLAQSGRAALSVLIYEESAAIADVAHATVNVSDGERHEIVLAGGAQARDVRIDGDDAPVAVLDPISHRVANGSILSLTGDTRTRFFERIFGRLVVLRLARTPPDPAPARQFRLSDGALVHRSSGNRDESRHEMMMAVLGRMRRVDAAPIFGAMAREGGAHLRWQAVRECLALDTALGFAALSLAAADSTDALAVPAGALRTQLIQAFPQLQALERSKCHA